MKDIKRWDVESDEQDGPCSLWCIDSPSGDFVKYDDHAAIIAELQKQVRDLEQRWEFRSPTPDAYEWACAALEKHRERADKAELQVKALALSPALQERDMKALIRFWVTSEDGQGYDVGEEAMSRLVELGVATKGPHKIRNISSLGRWILDRENGEETSQPLKTEDDHNADWSEKLAQLLAKPEGEQP